MMTIHLPDVSEFQPNVDWHEVASSNGGAAVIRALYGITHIDHAWYGGARRSDAHAKGIRALGIYAYLTATDDAILQAQAFVRLVGTLHPGEFAVVDVEEGDGNQLARVEAWLRYVNQHLNYAGYNGAWVYSGDNYARNHGLEPMFAGPTHTWVAAYQAAEPHGLGHTLWQHADAEHWPGIGACDCSVFAGTVVDLLGKIYTLAEGAPPHAPAPVSTVPPRHSSAPVPINRPPAPVAPKPVAVVTPVAVVAPLPTSSPQGARMNIAHCRKTVVATVGGILAWAQVAYVPDGHIDRAEWYGLAVTLATALGVYGISNRPADTTPSA